MTRRQLHRNAEYLARKGDLDAARAQIAAISPDDVSPQHPLGAIEVNQTRPRSIRDVLSLARRRSR